MAVAERGEAELTVGGQTYTLVLDIEAACELESMAGMRLPQVFVEVGQGSIRHTRWLIAAALRRHHPELTIDDIGKWNWSELMRDVGDVTGDLAKSAAPSKEDAKALKLKRPPKAQIKASTGPN